MHLDFKMRHIRHETGRRSSRTIEDEVYLKPNLDPRIYDILHEMYEFHIFPSIDPRKTGALIEIIDKASVIELHRCKGVSCNNLRPAIHNDWNWVVV